LIILYLYMKIIDSRYTEDELREKLRNDWYFEDDEYEGRISMHDKNSNNHVLIQSWGESYLVQPMIESDVVKGFSAKSSEIGKFESESLDGAIDHALYLINKSNKIFN